MSRAASARRTQVVAYDDQGGAIGGAALVPASRARARCRSRVLDGGIGKWKAEGRPLETAVPEVAPALFEPRFAPRGCSAKSADGAAAPARRWCWTRAPPSATAGTSSRSTRGPATSRARAARPTPGTWAPDSTFLPPRSSGALRRAGRDAREPIVYCGSGRHRLRTACWR